jgi:hypothetical protein
VYFETFEEKEEQSSGNDSDDTTLCEIDPLVSGLLQEEEELVIHEHETVLDGVHKEQHDFETTLVVASNVSDAVLFEDDNDINVELVSPSCWTFCWSGAKRYALSRFLLPSGPVSGPKRASCPRGGPCADDKDSCSRPLRRRFQSLRYGFVRR